MKSTFAAGPKNKDHLETEILFCACLTKEEAEKAATDPGGISFPSDCALQLKNVYRITDGVSTLIRADAYCGGSCPKDGDKCPAKPTPTVNKSEDGTTITEVYNCNCAAKAPQ